MSTGLDLGREGPWGRLPVRWVPGGSQRWAPRRPELLAVRWCGARWRFLLQTRGCKGIRVQQREGD